MPHLASVVVRREPARGRCPPSLQLVRPAADPLGAAVPARRPPRADSGDGGHPGRAAGHKRCVTGRARPESRRFGTSGPGPRPGALGWPDITGSRAAGADMSDNNTGTATHPLAVLPPGRPAACARPGEPGAAEERFRGLLEAAPDAMVIVDGTGTITLVNAQTEALFGYERGELLGQPVELLVPQRSRGHHTLHRDAYLA